MLVRVRQHPKAAEGSCTEVRNQSEVVLNDRSFRFDRAFDESMTQAHVFDVVGRPTLNAVLHGYNGTILAYGQTGSGKTYTMAGGKGAAEGLMPRLLAEVFGELARRQREAADDGSFYRCTCSYLQIHNEQITDLLSPSISTSSSLRIRETADRSTYVEGLRELRLRSATDALNALSAGGKRRSVASTAMNEVSSRSHAVFIFKLQHVTQAASGQQLTRTSLLNLVDLAGSERQSEEELPSEETSELSAPGAGTPGTRALLQEACHINRSLSALAGVIHSLNAGKTHVPYRDSKLTALLRDSLGGNARTWLIATLSPVHSCRSESLSTLLFAKRAQQVRNRAIVQPERPVPEGEEIGVSSVSEFAPAPAPFALAALAPPASNERSIERAEAVVQVAALQAALLEAEAETQRVTERATQIMTDASQQVDELQAALLKEASRASEQKYEQTRALLSRASAAEQMVRDAMQLVEAAENARDCAEEEGAQRVAVLRAEMTHKVEAAQAEMHAALAAAEHANVAKHASVAAMQKAAEEAAEAARASALSEAESKLEAALAEAVAEAVAETVAEAAAKAEVKAEANLRSAVEAALADAAEERAEAIAEAVRIERVRLTEEREVILTRELTAASANFDGRLQDALQAAATERAEADEAAAQRAALHESDAVRAAVTDALAGAQQGADAAVSAAVAKAVAEAVAEAQVEAEHKAAATLEAERLEWEKAATAKEAAAVEEATRQAATRATSEAEARFAKALAEVKASAFKEAEEQFASALSRELAIARAAERKVAASEAASEQEELMRGAETRLSSMVVAHKDAIATMDSERAQELKALRAQHEAATQHEAELVNEQFRALDARLGASAQAAQASREQVAALEARVEAVQQQAQDEKRKRLTAEAMSTELEVAHHMLEEERAVLEEELCLRLGAEVDLKQAEQSLDEAKAAAERRESEHTAAVSSLQAELSDQQAEHVAASMQQARQLSAERDQHAMAMRAATEEHERAMERAVSAMRDEAASLRSCLLKRDDAVAALAAEADEAAKAHREQVHTLNAKLGDAEVQLLFATDVGVSTKSGYKASPKSPGRAALAPLISNLMSTPNRPKSASKAAAKAPPSSAASECGPVEALVARALMPSAKSVSKAAAKAPPSSAASECGPVEALVARAMAKKRSVGGAGSG